VPEGRELLALVDAVPPIRGHRGRPRRRPDKLHGDKAYASRANRRALRERGIAPRIARPGRDSSSRLGRHRWIVEQRLSILHTFRRLRVRDERRADIHLAFLQLGCDLMLLRSLTRFC
jgi:IS5 family transposase